LAGLRDLPRPGATPRHGAETGKRIRALLDRPLPDGYGRWTAPRLPRELDQYIWRLLRANKVDLAARKSW
jgi:hypothetical protein